jgi:hypothetical protein
MICSVANCSATNSNPKVEDSTVFCFFENQDMGALLMYISMPVCNRHVSLSPAWSELTKQLICIACLLGSSALGGALQLHCHKVLS